MQFGPPPESNEGPLVRQHPLKPPKPQKQRPPTVLRPQAAVRCDGALVKRIDSAHGIAYALWFEQRIKYIPLLGKKKTKSLRLGHKNIEIPDTAAVLRQQVIDTHFVFSISTLNEPDATHQHAMLGRYQALGPLDEALTYYSRRATQTVQNWVEFR